MGRWAQQRKRGGHLGEESGLPAGPSIDWLSMDQGDEPCYLIWTTSEIAPFDFWRSRWRDITVTPLWTLSTDAAQLTVEDAQQACPFAKVLGHIFQWEAAYCLADGTLKSQWSAFNQVDILD